MLVNCTVKQIEPLASHTFRVLLHPETKVEFKAGQYLMVVMGEKDKRPFSIASSPCRHQGELELHIGAAEHNAYAIEVIEAMNQAYADKTQISVDIPHGNAYLQEDDSQNPLLLIAGGTGFSYVRSIFDHCVSQKLNRQIYLYWGAKDESQLYALSELEDICQEYKSIQFIPVVEDADASWNGKQGNVLQAVMDDFESLADIDVYIAGRFEMAGSARDQFVGSKGANKDRIFGDAFAFI